MLLSLVFLVLSLLLILLAAEGFTNGLEAAGKKFAFSQAVVGSILAAVGTALPETILPIVAIFFVHHGASKDVGLGAILGAPFMLSTVAFFIMGMTVTAAHARKRHAYALDIEPHTIQRDLTFFISMYSLAVILPLLTGRLLVVPIAVVLVCSYFFYVYLTVKSPSREIEHFQGLHIWKFAGAPHTALILAQVLAALCIMVFGSQVFVKNLESVSLRLGMDPLLFALILAPIATELPEKFNSVTWILKKRDSLAVGNITGAMVFQGAFPVSIGLVFTSWQVTGMALVSAVITLASAALVLSALIIKKRIPPFVMLLGGVFYAAYMVFLAFNWKTH